MDRIRTVDHRGTEIVHLDFSGLASHADAQFVLREAQETISSKPERSVLTLTDVTDATFDAKLAEGLWRLLRANKPHVLAGAVVGIGTEDQQMLFDLVTHQARRRMEAFDDVERAMDWLVEQAAADAD